jgi:hypothetical protein
MQMLHIVTRYWCYNVILHHNIIGPPSYMRSVVDRNVVMRRVPVHKPFHYSYLQTNLNKRSLEQKQKMYPFFTKFDKGRFVLCKNCSPRMETLESLSSRLTIN